MQSARSFGDLSSRSFQALKWNYLGSAVRAVSQFLVGVVLARLLGPEAFGTVAIGWLVVGVGMLFADLGFSAALVQREQLNEHDIRFVSTVQVCLGALFTVIGVALAGSLAAFFHRPEAAPTIRAMSLLFLVQSFGQTPLALLRRSLDFGAAQGINIASYLLGYVAVGIPCAIAGCGTWSLVAAQLLQSASSSFLALRRSRVSMRPAIRPTSSGLFTFGSKVIGVNLANWGIANLDSFAVGRALGVVDLGLYSRAMTLVASPTGAVTTGMQGVLFAACSRTQADIPTLRRAFLGAAAVVVVVCVPVFVTVASVPDAVIAGVYGSKWASAAPALVPLALAMPAYALLALVGPVLTAMNRVVIELRVQVVALAVMVPLLYLTSRYSLAAVGWGMFGLYVARCVVLVRALLTLLEAKWVDLVRVLVWPGVCAAAAAIATSTMDRMFIGAPAPLRLSGDIVVAGVTLAACGLLLAKQLLDGPHGEFLLGKGRLPAGMRQWLSTVRGAP